MPLPKVDIISPHNGSEVSVDFSKKTADWLRRNPGKIDKIAQKVTAEVWSKGSLVFVPLTGETALTFTYQEKGVSESSETIHYKGSDSTESVHRLIIDRTANLTFAPGITPPRSEYVAYDPVTGNSLKVETGEIMTKSSRISRGIGSIPAIGIVGVTEQSTSLLHKKTDGVVLWVHPDFVATEYKQNKFEQ